MNRGIAIGTAVGVFVGNWLGCPLISERTYTEGFFIGLIAAALVLLAYWIIYCVCW